MSVECDNDDLRQVLRELDNVVRELDECDFSVASPNSRTRLRAWRNSAIELIGAANREISRWVEAGEKIGVHVTPDDYPGLIGIRMGIAGLNDGIERVNDFLGEDK